MSEIKEIRTYFGRCRCCLNYGYLKNMWSGHDCEGGNEIYGEMLVQCFALPLKQLGSKDVDQICKKCVVQLRDANRFKKLVVESEKKLIKEMSAGVTMTTKTVIIDNLKSVIKTEKDQEPIMILQPHDSKAEVTNGGQSDDNKLADGEDIEYQEIVFLEEEEDYKEDLKADVSPDNSTREDAEVLPPKRKRKFPKRLKQYSAEMLRKCVETVVAEEMTAYEASEVFKIPRKTIVAKVKEYKELDQDPDKEATYKFIQEIKTLLTYTNATPYKTKANRFHCIYCPYEGVLFENSNELRTHTWTQHANDRVSKIEFAMRPPRYNEVLKLDIDNLLCIVCCTPIATWSDMFTHLNDEHGVFFELAYKRVIPYLLQDKKCAFCQEDFELYKHLDHHMDSHYNNYLCSECDSTFISSYRLKKHSNTHKMGFPCNYCSKVLSQEKSRKNHEEMYHKELTMYKCLYCKDGFASEYLRHLHVVDNHNEKTTVYTCEICGETFTWWLNFLTHKKKHKTA